MEAAMLRNAPTGDMRYPNGRARATVTELNAKLVRMRRVGHFFLEPERNIFSMAFTIGITISGYLAIGVIVVYMKILELILSLGRFKVI